MASAALEKAVRHVLSMDGEDDVTEIPQFVFDFMANIVKTMPNDCNFLLEAAEEGDDTKGGHGYGILTCMEDDCWSDIILSADPGLPDGGKGRGLGSIENYKMHVQEEPHIKAREKRIRRDAAIDRRNRSLASNSSSSQLAHSLSAVTRTPSMAQVQRQAALEEERKPGSQRKGVERYQRAIAAEGETPDGSDTETDEPEFKPRVKAEPSRPKTTRDDYIVVSSDSEQDIKPRKAEKRRRIDSSLGSIGEPIPIDSDEEKPRVKGKARQTYLPFRVNRDAVKAEEMEVDELDEEPVQQNQHTFIIAQAGTRAHRELEILDSYDKDLANSNSLRTLVKARTQYINTKVIPLISTGTPYVTITYPLRALFDVCPRLKEIWPEATTYFSKQAVNDRQALADAKKRLRDAGFEMREPFNAEAGPSRIPDVVGGPEQFLDIMADAGDYERQGVRMREVHRDGNELQKFFEDSLDAFAEDKSVNDAATALGLASPEDKLPSLRFSLMAHQVLGVHWMLSMERNKNRRGGLLCDSMGLGKTFQTIATMAENPSKDKLKKTTLIVAPLALCAQWQNEIRKFVKANWRVLVYHGNDKPGLSTLKSYDVVITTYGTLTAALPSDNKKSKMRKRDDDFVSEDEEADWRPKEKLGDLLKMNWYRVVLDESMIIRNRNTRAAKAAFALSSVLRWSLSGTIIVNKLTDVFSQFHFVGISEISVYEVFSKKVGRIENKKPTLATKRVQAVLKYCCLRRTADTKIGGLPILNLPPKTITPDVITFEADESTIYQAVEQKAKLRFNRYVRNGTVLRNYSHILTMILRLRQICDHVSLIIRKTGDQARHDDLLISNEDFNAGDTVSATRDGERARAFAKGGDELVEKLENKLQQRIEEAAQNEAEEVLDDDDAEAAEGEKRNQEAECAICFDEMSDAEERILSCAHSFCARCMEAAMNKPPPLACPICRNPYDQTTVFSASAFRPLTDEEEDVKLSANELNMDLSEKIPPSSKMIQTLITVQEFFEKSADDKILIFSSFRGMIDAVSDFLEENGIPNMIYTGGMTKNERDDTIASFTSVKSRARVLIVSTACGGVGLNLTAANKVIILDHTWTYAATSQAIDRAWRIGQQKPVEVREISVRGSIEERILQLQQKKKGIAEGAFGEGTGKKGNKRLSLNDLMMLFQSDAHAEDE